MRLLLIIGSFKTGGAERVCIKTGNELTKLGYDVHYVLQRNVIELPHNIPPEKIHILRKTHSGNIIYKFLALFLGIILITRKLKPDRIIAFSRLSSYLATFSFSKKIIARFDCNPYDLSKKQHRFADRVFGSSRVSHVVVPSSGMYNAIIKIRPKSVKKLVVIPNFIDRQQVIKLLSMKERFEPGYKYFVGLGRLTKAKNFKLLVAAYAKSKIRQKLKLILIGDGPLRAELENQISQQNLQNDVILTGQVSNPYTILKNAEFLVNSSIKEGLPNVLLEALSVPLPIIATDCPHGASDIVIEGRNGFLARNNDEVDLVRLLDLFADQPELLEEHKRHAELSLSKFEVQSVMDQWQALIKKG